MPRPKRDVQTPGETAPEAVTGETIQALVVEAEAKAVARLRACDVDPSKIKRAVLTADGWVCPATVPVPAGVR